MYKPLLISMLSAGLLACASDGSSNKQYRDHAEPRITDVSYMGKANVFPASLNGAPAFNSLANTTGQSERGKAVRYFLKSEDNKTNASVTVYLLTTLGNGDTVAAHAEKEIDAWTESISSQRASYRVEPPEEVYSSELGGVDFYFGETIQNHATAYDLYMAEVNDRLLQIRLVGPATRSDRIARREVVSQIAEHLTRM